MNLNETDVLLKVVNESDEEIIKREEKEAWETIYAARQNQSTILKSKLMGIEKVNERVCGIVRIGSVKGFIPIEHSGFETPNQMRKLVGQEIIFKITQLDRNGGIFAGSRQAAVDHLQGDTWNRLRESQKVVAKVVNISRRVVDLDVGGIVVPLPVGDLSYQWIDDLTDYYKVGQELIVRVKEVNKKEKILKVSRKDLLPNPWPDCARRFHKQSEYVGTVSGTAEYGCFVNLEPGVDCLTPQANLHDIGRLGKGDSVLVKILDISIKNKQITARIIRKI
jgi:small subunit ribosomal protein S1